MKNLLIKFSTNYADEFYIEGFIVMSEAKWETHKAKVTKLFEKRADIEIYFGSNESITYESLEDYLSSFSVTEISDTEYSVLKKLFGSSYGTISNGMLAMIENF